MTKIKGNPIPCLQQLLLFVILLLSCPTIAQAGPAADTTKPGVQAITNYVGGLFKQIQDSGHFVDALGMKEIGKLPVGIVREINGKVYVIAIDSARLTPNGASFNAYFRFTFPGTKSELVFGAKNVAFTPGGIGASSSTKLVLLNDKDVNINEHVNLFFAGDGTNFIEWDCNGFKSANLAGEFRFDKAWLVPEDTAAKMLTAKMQVNVKDLSDIMATIEIPAFHIAGLNDFSFKVQNATVDMSDVANPTGLSVTGDMLEDPGSPLLWRGFYMQQLEVGLPKQLATKNGRANVIVNNFYIDDQGVSGSLVASNIIPFGNASAGGWPLSISKLGLSFSKNKLNGGTMGGQMNIPFLGKDPLDYDATVNMRGDDTYYQFALGLSQDKTYEFFAGEITLSRESRIEVTKTETDFIPKATLNGKVNLNKSVLSVKGITFQNLVLSTQKPYVHNGIFSLATNGDSKMASFPVSFDNINLGISGGKIAIGAELKLNFMNSGDKGFSGSTSFTITALQEEKTDSMMVDNDWVKKVKTNFSLDKVQINDINLEVKVMAFKMKGIITLFREHPTFGNGFRGNLTFSLPGPIPEAKATAYFGSKDDYRYYHVDVYVGLNIPIPPALTLKGLMAGLSYHMERPSDFDPYTSRDNLDKSGGLKDMNEIFQYVPSADAGLGLMGGVSLAFKAEMLVNVNASLEVQFGTDGGFRYCQFDGAGYVLHQPVKAASKSEADGVKSAPVWVTFKMRYDNINSSFDASMKTYINMTVLQGEGEGGLVGESALHIGQDDWYFYIGRPSQQLGLKILGLATVRSYFMTGNKVEDIPALPTMVSSVLSEYKTNVMNMSSSLANGSGLAFGASFNAKFGFDFGVYGEFAIVAGADVCLRDMKDSRCKGSNEVLGINGWYASGQAYAGVSGDVGVRVKVFGKKRGFSIAKLSAALLLQAKMPNPAWFRGIVGVKYSVLGGMVKGSASIKVELGTQCEIASGRELDIAVINDIKPDDNTSDVNTYSTPQAAFNMPINKPFSMLNNDDVVKTYRIALDGITLLKDKEQINGTVELAADGLSASLRLRDVLPEQSKMTATATVHFERQDGANWVAVMDSTNKAIDYERKSTAFTTGDAPDHIDWEYVAYTYPLNRQFNFLPKEYPSGYIKLDRGLPHLFKSVDSKGRNWKVTAVLTPANGKPVETDFYYDEGMSQLNFTIPNSMRNETVYGLSFTRTSLDGASGSENVKSGETTNVSEDGDSTSVANNTLKGDANSNITKELIGYSFRTSKYNTFVEKMSNASNPVNVWDIAVNYISVIGQRWDLAESFDRFEMQGDATFHTKPLMAVKANTNNAWLKDQIMPLMYTGYPFEAGMTISRDATWGGIPPLEAIRITNYDNSACELDDNQILNGYAPSTSNRGLMMYYLSYVVNLDFHELEAKASKLYLSKSYSSAGDAPEKVRKLLTTVYPDLQGNIFYPVDIEYRLPGTNHITTSITKSIYYKL